MKYFQKFSLYEEIYLKNSGEKVTVIGVSILGNPRNNSIGIIKPADPNLLVVTGGEDGFVVIQKDTGELKSGNIYTLTGGNTFKESKEMYYQVTGTKNDYNNGRFISEDALATREEMVEIYKAERKKASAKFDEKLKALGYVM